jgi:tetratricopeptide (TPR) repeat protein
MTSLPAVAGLTLTGDYATAAIPARYAVELGHWNEASRLPEPSGGLPWAQAITWAAIGVGSARTGSIPRAAEAEEKLAGLRDATAKQNNRYWADQIEVQRREVAAWIAEKNGKSTDAIATMRSAAELEESMDKHAVTPGAVTPGREMLAQLLLIEKHPQEALNEYQAVLKVAPNRFNALYGASRAADAAGDKLAAGEYLRKLTQIAVGEERPELAEARKKIASVLSSR